MHPRNRVLRCSGSLQALNSRCRRLSAFTPGLLNPSFLAARLLCSPVRSWNHKPKAPKHRRKRKNHALRRARLLPTYACPALLQLVARIRFVLRPAMLAQFPLYVFLLVLICVRTLQLVFAFVRDRLCCCMKSAHAQFCKFLAIECSVKGLLVLFECSARKL